MSIIQNSDRKTPEARRSLGLAVCTALVIGNMVGSGVYLLPASLAPYGGWSLGGWGVTTIGAVLLALVFARLSRRIPRAGGPYAYARAGFGSFGGFFVAWGYWISMVTANAAIAVAFASYLSVFVPALDNVPILGAGAALAGVWLLTLVNIRGVHHAGNVQLITTVLKLLPLVAVGIIGLWYFHPASIFESAGQAGTTGPSAINASAALTLWAFLGLESATVPAQHVRDANRTIPRATMIGTLITAAVYIFSTTVVMGLVPNATLAHTAAPFAEAARRMWGGWAGYLMAAGGVVACFGTLNGWVMMQGQLPQAVANDGLFPRIFARETRWGTPAVGLVISGVVVSLLVGMNYTRGLVGLFTFVIRVSTLSTLIPYLFATLADWAFARGDAKALGVRVYDALLALAAFAYVIWAIAGIGKDAVYWGFLLMLVGIPVYVWITRRGEPAAA